MALMLAYLYKSRGGRYLSVWELCFGMCISLRYGGRSHGCSLCPGLRTGGGRTSLMRHPTETMACGADEDNVVIRYATELNTDVSLQLRTDPHVSQK